MPPSPAAARRALAAALAAALALGCAGGRFTRRGEDAPYEVRTATFPSGLRVVVFAVPGAERFSVTVSYGAGSGDDPPGAEGLAHLVEHLAYRATPGGGPPLQDRLGGAALLFNATTSPDATDYVVVGKPADLDAALAVEAARLRGPLDGVTERDAAVERDVVLAEYRERFETDPEGAQVAWLLEAAFPDHPYGRPAAGTPESIRGLSLAAARAWAAPRYVPANAIVVVVAPGDAAETLARTRSALGALADGAPAPLPARPARGLPGRARERERGRRAPVPGPVVWVAWPVPGVDARVEPQALYAATALEAAFAGKLRQAFGRTAPDVVEDFSAAYEGFEGAGLVVLRAELADGRDAGRIADLARSAAFELRTDEDVKGGPETGAFGARTGRALGDAEKERLAKAVRDGLLVAVDLGMERLDGGEIARAVRLGGDPDVPARWRREARAELAHDPGRLAARHLLRDRAVVLTVTPDENALARALVAAPGGERRDEDAALAGPAPGPEAARAAAPAPGLDGAERRVLQNGLTVVVARKGALPIAQVELVVRTRVEGGPGVPAGLPAVALGAARARLADHDLSLVGAGRALRRKLEYVRRVHRGTRANLDVLLESAAEWALDRRVRALEESRDLLARRVARREGRPEAIATRALHGALFPDHPYGAVATSAALRKVRSGAAERWLDEELRPERATLVVVSDEGPTPALWRRIEARFGPWPRGGVPRDPAPPPPAPAARRVLLVDRPGASQALVVVGLRTPPREAADEPAIDAVRWLVGARLDRQLRRAEGASYGVAVGGVEHARGAAVLAAAAVPPEAAGHAADALLGTFAALASDGPGEEDAARARFHVAREFGYAFDGIAGAAAALTTLAVYDLPPDHFERQPASIAALDPGRIRKAAASLAIGREVVVVVGDAGVVSPRLEAAGLVVERAAGP
jgi:zinc protease